MNLHIDEKDDNDGIAPTQSDALDESVSEYTIVSSCASQGPNNVESQKAPRRNAAYKTALSHHAPLRAQENAPEAKRRRSASSCQPVNGPPNEQRPIVAVLGDSNTKGYPWVTAFKATNSLSFPQLIEQRAERWHKRFRITVRTFARCGASIMGAPQCKSGTPGFFWSQAFNEFVTLRPRPVVIVICLGTNDAKIFSRRRGDPVPPDNEFREAVRDFFRRLRLLDPDVPILVVRPFGLRHSLEHDRIASILEAEANARKKVYFLQIDDQRIEYATDRIHLTPQGHVQLLDQLMKPLRKLIGIVSLNGKLRNAEVQVEFPPKDLLIPPKHRQDYRRKPSRKQHVISISSSDDDDDAQE